MSKQLKIAFIVNEFPCISEVFILNQIVGLLQLGHQVRVFADERRDDQQNQHGEIEEFGLLKKVKYFPPIPEKRSVRAFKLISIFFRYIILKPKWVLGCLNFRQYGAYEALNNLFHSELLVGECYDVIHCQYGTVGKKWVFLKEVMDVKIITSFRGYDITRYLHETDSSVYDELFQKGDWFLPVCQYFSDRLEKLNCPKDRITVLHSGIDIGKYQYRDRVFNFQKNIKVLSVGRLVEKKGFKYVIYAVEKLVKKYPNIQYTIVGKGILENELKQLVVTLKLEKNVHFINSLINGELKEAYYQAQIFILPCVKSVDNNLEGIPNVLKEAMATGLPVISTQHSGIPELIEHGKSGFLIAERDVNGIVDSCERLISNPRRCLEFGQAGRKFVEDNFEISKLSNRLVGLYRQPPRLLAKSRNGVM